MKRTMIAIDREKCNGCGLCAEACHEGAIAVIDGKAVLTRDDYCDGLGNCLPVCPTGAICFEEREAAPFDEAAVKRGKQAKRAAGGCPGSRAAVLRHEPPAERADVEVPQSALAQWPVQLKLVPVNAAYFSGAHLLIAADCAAYAHANFHAAFMRGKITLIGCPKLDEGDYSEKLTEILRMNPIKSVTIVRMEVPCCGGLAAAAITALGACGKMIPWSVVTLSTDGRIPEQ